MEAKYWFYLALVSIIVAYYVGASNVLTVLGNQTFKLAQLSFGRNSQGNYPGYPTGG